jgi:hypothetical protein
VFLGPVVAKAGWIEGLDASCKAHGFFLQGTSGAEILMLE